MTATEHDFSDVAPEPARGWQVTLTRLLARYSPYRIPTVRRRVIRAMRARKRRRRRREEAAGSDRLSRPALYAMERRLEHYLPERGGFYVEAGANDGFDQSNTYWLERFRGWRGILVEPIPELYEEVLREQRNAQVFNCALLPFGDESTTVTMRYGGLMSVVSGTHGSEDDDAAYVAPAFQLGLEQEYTVEVPARTLSSILDEAGAPEIDLLSLDVEGFEPEVLRGLDLDRHAPRFLLCEIRDMADGRERVEEVLGDRYEPVEQISPYDMLYARSSSS
jgi:FkbM family methyltransferase